MLSKLIGCRSGAILRKVTPLYERSLRVTAAGTHVRFMHSADDELSLGGGGGATEVSFNAFNDIIIPEPPFLDPTIIYAITEPSFASIGLNNYTPPGLVQFILENVHVYCNLPWWACIGITAVLLRTCMLPVMLKQRRVMAGYQNNMSKMTKIIVEAMNAKESGNSIFMMSKIKEFSHFVQNQSMGMFDLFKPIVIQAPLFISVFMALRGMAEAPVASLKAGGLSWFIDLTVYDPYYILPLITVSSLALVIETGAEAPGPQSKNIKWVLRCIAPVTFLIICHFPSTLLLYWTCSNMYSLIFATLMKMPEVQKSLNIPDIQPPNFSNPNNYGMKDVMNLLQSLQEVEMRHKAEKIRWMKEEQEQVLNEGLTAVKERKKIRSEVKTKELNNMNSDEIKKK